MRRNSSAAFGAFYDRHDRGLFSFLAHHTVDREVALELTAEAFAVAYLRLRSFGTPTVEPRNWLLGIGRFVLLSSYCHHAVEERARRQLGMTVRVIDPLAWDEAEAHIEATLPQLVPGLDDLPPEERLALVAQIVDHYDRAGSARPGASSASIGRRLAGGLRALRRPRKRGPR